MDQFAQHGARQIIDQNRNLDGFRAIADQLQYVLSIFGAKVGPLQSVAVRLPR